MATVVTRLQIFDSPDWLELDLFPDFAIPADFSYYSITNIANLEMPISSQVSLPNTETNRLRLGVSNDASLKPADLDARVLVDGVVIYKYRLKIDSVITLGLNERIECTLIDPVKQAVEQLKDMDLSDLVSDGEYDEPFSTAGIEAVNNNVDEFIRIIYQDFNGFGEDDARAFAFRNDTDFDEKDGVQQIVPALQVKQIFSKAFSEVGLSYDSKFFEGTSEIENYPVDDLYVTTPTRFFLDKDKAQPISGTWADERTDTALFWSATPRAQVFGFTELYQPNNSNNPHPLGLNYLKRNNIIAGQSGSQYELFDIATLNSSNGIFTTSQMVFKKPARYSLSAIMKDSSGSTISAYPKLGIIRTNQLPSGSGFVGAATPVELGDGSNGGLAPSGDVGIYLCADVSGSIKQAKVATISLSSATWNATRYQFEWGATSISVPSDFYIDVDTGDTVELYITMQSENGEIDHKYPFSGSFQGLTSLNEFGQRSDLGAATAVFSLADTTTPVYQLFGWYDPISGPIALPSPNATNPTYDITFSPYEEFPASTISGSEYMDFKFNLAKATKMSLWDVMTDIAKRFNMSIIYDFATDTVIVDNVIEEYVKPSITEQIAHLFDNASELTQDFNTSSIKSIKLLNASGKSLSDKNQPNTSPFATENEVDTFGSLNLFLDSEGGREESFQSKMLLANGKLFGEPISIFDFEEFKERVKYGIPNNTPLRCSDMGMRIGFLGSAVETRIYQPIYEVTQNMVKLEYELENSLNPSAPLPTLREYSSPVLIGGDIETYNLRFDDNTDTFRAYQNFWNTFVNIINDLPSVECSLVIEAGDLSVLDFRRKYDFGYGDTVLTSISGFDFTLKGSKVKAKFLVY